STSSRVPACRSARSPAAANGTSSTAATTRRSAASWVDRYVRDEQSGRSSREDARPNRGGRPSARALTPADGVGGHRAGGRPQRGRAFWAAPARSRPPQQRGEAERESAHAGRRGLGAPGSAPPAKRASILGGARAKTPAPTAGGGRARERSRRPTGSGGTGAAQRPKGTSSGRAPRIY